MKAAVYTEYGAPEVVQIKEIAKPELKDNEILVKVNATTVTAGDWRMRAGEPFAIKLYNGIRKPKRTILGHEFSGIVEAVNSNGSSFRKGDHIFGLAGQNGGAHAAYVAVPANGTLSLKPEGISDAAAAALPVGATAALFFLRKANIQPGQKVLIYGASGSVGTYAVQLAKILGAEVTAVCSTANTELVRSLGADKVIDYTRADFTQSGEAYDCIFDAVGKADFRKSKKALVRGGIFLTVAMSMRILFQSLVSGIRGSKRLITGISKSTTDDLNYIKSLVNEGKLKAVIDHNYPFSDIVKAHQHAQTHHKKGNIVVTL